MILSTFPYIKVNSSAKVKLMLLGIYPELRKLLCSLWNLCGLLA